MSAVDTLVTIVGYVDTAADIALPLAGQGELVPLVDALNAVLKKVVAAAEAGGKNALAAEVATADLAAQAAELAAGLK